MQIPDKGVLEPKNNTYALAKNTVVSGRIIGSINKQSEDETAAIYHPSNSWKDIYVMEYGPAVESKYGYAAEFDNLSRAFARAVYDHNYSSANAGTVVADMEEKYQSLKKDIENNYSGEERAERLAELDKMYDLVMEKNVTGALAVALGNESAMNKIRIGFAKLASPGTENWLGLCAEIDAELERCKGWFEVFKETLANIHEKPENASYADSLLKKMTAGLTAVNETKEMFTRSNNKAAGGAAQEISDLIEQKAQIYSRSGKVSNDDSEKYQSFLENKKQSDALDKKLSELLKSLEQ